MESLKTSIENLNDMFHQRMAQFENKLQTNTSPPSTISGLTADFAAFREFVTQALKGLQQQVEILAQGMDHLDMQGRRKILLFHGVQEEKKEDLVQTVIKVIKDHLKIQDFTESNIKRCHRMGRSSAPNSSRPILVKFLQVTTRDQVWFTKTKLRGSGITVSEFLTKARHDIFLAAREKFGVSKCWTKQGTVYVLGANGERHRINSQQDIQNLRDLVPSLGQTKQAPLAARTESVKPRRAVTIKK